MVLDVVGECDAVTALRKKPRATVFTIGHSTRPLAEFVEILRAHGVERVVDVRSIPRSRHNPQFNRESLARHLRAARIGYVHLKKLGGLRHARADSTNLGWHNASFRGFADYMQTGDFQTGLARLEKLAAIKPIGDHVRGGGALALPSIVDRGRVGGSRFPGGRYHERGAGAGARTHAVCEGAGIAGLLIPRISLRADDARAGETPALRESSSVNEARGRRHLWAGASL